MKENRFRGVCKDHEWFSLAREEEKDAELDLQAHIDSIPDEDHNNSYIETIATRTSKKTKDLTPILKNSRFIEEPRSYGYVKGTGLRIGKSFNPINVLDIKRPAIEFEMPSKVGAGKSSLDLYYVDSYHSLQKVIRNDTRLSASYLSNSGNYSNSSELDYSFNESSLRIVLKAETDYGEWIMGSDAKLTPKAQELLSNPDEFSSRFGTRYINSENRINALFVIFTIYNVNKKTKKTFKNSISASVGFGKLNAGAKSTFKKIISESWKSNRMSFSVSSIGGTGVDSLSTILENIIQEKNNPLPFIISSVEKMLKTFTIENAWPNEFFVADFKNFGLSVDSSLEWSEERNDKLIKCKENYFKLKYKYDVIKEIKNRNHLINDLYDYGNVDDLINNDLSAIKEKITELAELHNELLTSSNVNSIIIPDVSSYGIDDYTLKRFLKLPTPNFQGRYLIENSNEYRKIGVERLTIILNTPKNSRNQVIKNFYPNSTNTTFSIAPLGEGISVIKLSYKLYLLNNDQWNELFETNRYTGPWGGFSLIGLENEILDYVQNGSNQSSSRKDYQIVFNLEIVNKGQQSHTYELFRCSWYDQNQKPNDILIEFNVI